MSGILFLLFMIIATIRLYVLKISNRNANRLINKGAVEYGKTTSKWLAILHTLFYFSAFFEGIIRKASFDLTGFIGICLIVFSFIMLFWVMKLLGNYWSVKLIFENNHQLVHHWLFERVKHPNYFLNILPELLGVGLLFHAYMTFGVFILPYSFCLYSRIKEENQLLASISYP
ncbi:MAG: isoprenylcysteine carboxyl methyltransferase family protein [Enterococcus lacertideformus]|uniref:Isoprenylcysteine carboxyl methyltransferase family protein n=1 Tax=Enterococcus lacertideformus TaxID=2771493 RepID=A0A931F9F2_9ENTE|nr:isoprenylcysteine carboxyl methyltransferase family protein [Enterococcus lacertideformus]